ncbi:C6 zinc finger domain containing protein [Colletotrichum truncatum]|uniref:C6 zinc finger domain containing protein n=1 Tax=Colletotrichum truncatum TaxID=5467 RepID=A0ACC3YVV9_COLTU|nr:C6 zinc finger domain containing protein [Colletotrichum truncatum]KAF6791239.1 C6 zinc finger domain containing protein [Colletotrichum truncatum]
METRQQRSDGDRQPSPLSTSPVSPASGRLKAKIVRNQKACDVCRARKVRCLYGAGEIRCQGCTFLNIQCTHERPRRRRGPPNKHAQQQQQQLQEQEQQQQQQQGNITGTTNQQSPAVPNVASPNLELVYQASPASSLTPTHHTPSSHSYNSASSTVATPSDLDPGALVGAPSPITGQHGNWLARFAPEDLVHRMLDDWFEKVHSLAPILHRRRFMYRLKAGEARTNGTFCGLVVSVCAATVATLKRADYSPVTVAGCLDFIEENHLLYRGIRNPAYSVDWCIAMYNVGTSASSMNENGLTDLRSFHAISEAAAGARYLAYYHMTDLDMPEQQMLKRLFWLIFSAYYSADSFGKLSVIIISHQENCAHLRPLPLTDSQLDTRPQLSVTELPPWHGDDTSYILGLNHLSDLCLTWHEAQTAPSSTYDGQEGALKHYLNRIQSIIDSFPPELRWRGGLSRPVHATEGHDTQIANLFITSLHIRSNLLQKFRSTVETRAFEHQRIVDDLLEILYHMPEHVLEQNGNSLVPKLRDCGAAYMEQMTIGDGEGGEGPGMLVSESARFKLEKLLRKLDDIDYWPGHTGVESPQTMRK